MLHMKISVANLSTSLGVCQAFALVSGPQPGRAPSQVCHYKRTSKKKSALTQRWGNTNRLSPNSGSSRLYPDSDGDDRFDDDMGFGNSLQHAKWKSDEFLSNLAYRYYNWREDTLSDLTLFMGLSALLFLAAANIQSKILAIDATLAGKDPAQAAATAMSDPSVPSWWMDLYRVLKVVLAADLPDVYEAGVATQAFAVAVSIFGLASFALVLALIEQVVLEVLETNVKRGSPVHEKDHIVILAWCESARDLGQVTRMLEELCAANRPTGGNTVVVLAQEREKLELEAMYRETIPRETRFNSQFVFRQGSPLDPAALDLVAATDARAIIIGGDYSRSPTESDAQVLRCAVLLDEMITERYGPGVEESTGPVIVAEVDNQDSIELMRYACSSKVIPVPTTLINVKRYARLIKQPIMAVLSQMLSDHRSVAHGHLGNYPQLVGRRFRDLHFMFPQAIIYGLYNKKTGYCRLNPPVDRELRQGDEIVMLAPGWLGDNIKCLKEPIKVDPGDWSPDWYETCAGRVSTTMDLGQAGMDCSSISARVMAGTPITPSIGGIPVPRSVPMGQLTYLLSPQYHRNCMKTPVSVVICGWPGVGFLQELLVELDRGVQKLPPGSSIILVNDHDWSEMANSTGLQDTRNVEVGHVKCDPRSKAQLKNAVEMMLPTCDAAVVMHDTRWAEETGNQDDQNTGYRLSQADMLRLDAAVLMVQLNIRQLLEEANRFNITIITEKMTYIGVSRFEDNTRLPLGNSVNSASYAAKILAQVACDARTLKPYMLLGVESENIVQDSSVFAREGEELSFLQLQARAASVRQVLVGYYRLPAPGSYSDSMDITFNPQGMEARTTPRVWNNGDGRCKVVTMALKSTVDALNLGQMDKEVATPYQ